MRVVGVELDKNGRVLYFDAVELKLDKGDLVVVDAEKGITMGTVVSAPQVVKSGLCKRSLQKVISKATAKDVKEQER
ncbi:MAG: stage 0 sporulation protein, partial [Deltaproteobacteria bacterium]|nr:stage 0 sporulation protein [Deltaproteobacteria bacterium]